MLSTVVYGQEELCEIRTAEAVEQQLELATEALESVDLSRARAELELARGAARCLGEPIAPEQLAHLAYLHAEFGVFDQDLDKVWRWVRLAQDAAPEVPLPEHIGLEHPLRRFLPDAPDSPPIEGPDRVVVHPRRGAVYMDGSKLERPEARRETPHLIQVFENKELATSWWQSGPRFRPEILGIGEPEPEPERGPKNWKPAKRDTVRGWESWIAKNPDSEWVAEARKRLDLARFDAAKEGGEAGLKAYLRDDPGPQKRNARAALEKLRYDAAEAEGTRQAWAVFLNEYPHGFYSTEAEDSLDELSWEKFSAQDTDKAYARYLTQHRDGAHREEARALLSERVYEAAIASGEEGPLRAFRARFPTSPHTPRVLAMLAGTRFQAVQIAIGGLEDAAEMEAALRDKLEPDGVRVERVDFERRVRNTKLPAGNGLVWVEVSQRDTGLHAEASLWAPVGSGPLSAWRADADDLEGLISAVVKGLPSIAEWREE